MQKIKNIISIMMASGKQGRRIFCFQLLKNVIFNFKDCAVTIIVPIALMEALEKRNYKEMFFFLASIFTVLLLLSIFLEWLDNIYIRKQYAGASKKILSTIFKKIADSDYKCFDDASFYEKNILNMNVIEEKVFAAIENITTIMSCIFVFTLNFAFILTISRDTWFFVLTALVLSVVLQFCQARFNLKYQKEAMPLNRRAEALGHYLLDYDYAREVRNSKRFDMLMEQVWQEKQKGLLYYRSHLAKFIGYTFGQLFSSTFLLKVLYLVYLAYRCLVFKDYSCAGVLVAYNASENLFSILTNISSAFTKYDDISLYANNYKEIVNYRNEIVGGNKLIEKLENIEFRNVSFHYPGTDKIILNHINFRIEKNEKVALVGRNGSGKTTIIKLLLRMYEPTEGEILVNGINIKEYALDHYRHFFGVLFQDMGTFNATIKENVCYDHTEYIDLRETLDKVGIYERIERMEKKIDTCLGHDIFEDGISLSGGEQQRILLARALAKNANMLVMDEPTSHIDPEADIKFSMVIFDELIEKTVLYITHRLLSTRKASKILVLNENGMVESGSHIELLNRSELYKSMYEAQEKNYAG